MIKPVGAYSDCMSFIKEHPITLRKYIKEIKIPELSEILSKKKQPALSIEEMDCFNKEVPVVKSTMSDEMKFIFP